jgi:hypothetical protein
MIKIDHIPVKSSNIESYGYHEPTGALEIKFIGNAKPYTYNDVPKHVVEAFTSASSKGKHLHQHIKGRFKVS